MGLIWLPLTIVPNPLLGWMDCHMRSSEGVSPQKKPVCASIALPYWSLPAAISGSVA